MDEAPQPHEDAYHEPIAPADAAPAARRHPARRRRTALPSWDLSDLYPGARQPRRRRRLRLAPSRRPRAFADRVRRAAGGDCRVPRWPPRSRNTSGSRRCWAGWCPMPSCCSPAIPPMPTIGRFYQTASERVTTISSDLLFFTLELNRLDDATLEQKLRRPGAGALAALAARPARVPAASALRRAGEAAAREGSDRPQRLEPAVRRDLAGDARPARRRGTDRQRRAEQAVRSRPSRARGRRRARSARRSATNIRLFSLITNTLAKDKEIVDTWRHYPRPGSYRNRSNMVEDEVVDALVVGGAGRLSAPRRIAIT